MPQIPACGRLKQEHHGSHRQTLYQQQKENVPTNFSLIFFEVRGIESLQPNLA